MSDIGTIISLSCLFRQLADTLGDQSWAVEADEMLMSVARQDADGLMRKWAVPSPWRTNYDYGEGWHKIMDDYRSGKIKTIRDFIKKKRKVTKKSSYVGPIDSYCGSKRNKQYWASLLKGDPKQDAAVHDFLEYIQSVSCGGGE